MQGGGRVERGGWKAESGGQSAEGGVWSVECGEWSIECGGEKGSVSRDLTRPSKYDHRLSKHAGRVALPLDWGGTGCLRTQPAVGHEFPVGGVVRFTWDMAVAGGIWG